jgi:hypothetical protein
MIFFRGTSRMKIDNEYTEKDFLITFPLSFTLVKFSVCLWQVNVHVFLGEVR